MEEILKLLKRYGDQKGYCMLIILNHDGNGWVEDNDEFNIYIEFKNIKDLKYQLEIAVNN